MYNAKDMKVFTDISAKKVMEDLLFDIYSSINARSKLGFYSLIQRISTSTPQFYQVDSVIEEFEKHGYVISPLGGESGICSFVIEWK